MNAAVCRIGEPKFLFIRGQSDAMAWTPVALSQTFLVARNLDTVEDLSVGRYSHPVTAAIVSLFPDLLFGDEIEAAQPLGRADVELRGPCAGGYALDVLGHLAWRHVPGRNSLDELVSVINIEDQDT